MVIRSRLESGPSPYKLGRINVRLTCCFLGLCGRAMTLCCVPQVYTEGGMEASAATATASLSDRFRVADSNGRRSVSRLLRGSYVNMETGSWNPVLDSTYDSNQRG